MSKYLLLVALLAGSLGLASGLAPASTGADLCASVPAGEPVCYGPYRTEAQARAKGEYELNHGGKNYALSYWKGGRGYPKGWYVTVGY